VNLLELPWVELEWFGEFNAFQFGFDAALRYKRESQITDGKSWESLG